MRVLQINLAYAKGSTGKIVKSIAEKLVSDGHEAYAVYSYGKEKDEFLYPMKNIYTLYMGVIRDRLFGRSGFYDKRVTKKLIKWIDKVHPDIVHLHNIHGFYLNIEILFRYLRDNNIPIIWTLHDCWSITGHCAYFDCVNCEKWKTGCFSCEQLKYYPIAYVDRTKKNYQEKKRIFTSISEKNLTLVVPSDWLKSIIKESYLKKYAVKRIYNGIDLDIFTSRESNFKEKHNILKRKMILAVCFGYNERKGILDLNILAEKLDDTYQLVLVGVSEKYRKHFDERIMLIPKTDSQEELADIYSAADVFINLTYEDVLGLVNLEALACGTPVITYRSGGCPECIDDTTGIVIDKGNIEALSTAIKNIVKKDKNLYYHHCVNRAAAYFDQRDMVSEYIQLYEKMLRG